MERSEIQGGQPTEVIDDQEVEVPLLQPLQLESDSSTNDMAAGKAESGRWDTIGLYLTTVSPLLRSRGEEVSILVVRLIKAGWSGCDDRWNLGVHSLW